VRTIGNIRVFLLIGGLAFVALLLMVYFLFQPPKPEPLPNPNGYDDFVAAGEMIKGKIPDWKEASAEELRGFVSTNRGALDRGLLGLNKRCRVPTEDPTTWIQRHQSQLMAAKLLARAFFTEGKLAELEKRPGAAATSYLSAIKMGAVLAHGGVIIDGLVATACEGAGEQGLESELETLDIKQSRALITELEKVEAEQEPSAQILKQEKRWMMGELRSVPDGPFGPGDTNRISFKSTKQP
jgi:hypothetical protein